MKLAAFALLSALAVSCFAEGPAHITVFREKSPGNSILKQYAQAFGVDHTWVNPHFIFRMFIDGAEVTRFQPGHFVTFDVPAGRHEVRTNHSDRLIVDLKPGQRAFVRPTYHNNALTAPEFVEQVDSCQKLNAYLEKKPIQPVKPKNIRFGEVAPENSFPACDETGQSK
jgi:hypothetical protein